MQDTKRYTVTTDQPPEGLPATSRVLWLWLQIQEEKHQQGTSKEESFLKLDYSPRKFDRAWSDLEAAHAIRAAPDCTAY